MTTQPSFLSEWGTQPRLRYENDQRVQNVLLRNRGWLGDLYRMGITEGQLTGCQHTATFKTTHETPLAERLWELHQSGVPCLWTWHVDIDQEVGGRYASYFRVQPRMETVLTTRLQKRLYRTLMTDMLGKRYGNACWLFEQQLERLLSICGVRASGDSVYPFVHPSFPIKGYWPAMPIGSFFLDCEDYYTRAFALLARQPSMVQHTYFYWCKVFRYSLAPHRSLINQYRQEREGTRDCWPTSYSVVRMMEATLPEELSCLQTIQDSYPRSNWIFRYMFQSQQFWLHAIDRLHWLEPGVRQRMTDKMQRLRWFVGGPFDRRWFSSRPFAVDSSVCFACNVVRMVQRHQNENVARVGLSEVNKRPRTLWHVFGVFEATAMYNARSNTMTLPAGLLRAVRPDSPPVLLWAFLLRIINHEMAHAVDPFSIHFDANGRFRPLTSFSYRNWTQPIKKIAAGCRKGFTEIRPPAKAMAEAFADLAGMEMITHGYLLRQPPHLQQQFFQILKSFAQTWTPQRADIEWHKNPHGSMAMRICTLLKNNHVLHPHKRNMWCLFHK